MDSIVVDPSSLKTKLTQTYFDTQLQHLALQESLNKANVMDVDKGSKQKVIGLPILTDSEENQLFEVLADIFSKVWMEGLHLQKLRKRMRNIFEQSRMCETNRRLNQSVEQSTVFDIDQQNNPFDQASGYLQTERGDEPDYRASRPSRRSMVAGQEVSE